MGALGVDLGILPPGLVANGHAWGIKHTLQRAGRTPLAAHYTHVFGALGQTMRGKISRMRHMGDWRGEELDGAGVSDDGVSTAQGRVLLLRSLPKPEDVGSREAMERSKALERWNVKLPQGFPPHLREATPKADERLWAHVELARQQRRGVFAGLVTAVALGFDTLVLPADLWCACDRSSGGHDNIFATSCMVPGSERDDFLPYSCAPDQLFDVDMLARQAGEMGVALRYAPELPQERARGAADYFAAGCGKGKAWRLA